MRSPRNRRGALRSPTQQREQSECRSAPGRCRPRCLFPGASRTSALYTRKLRSVGAETRHANSERPARLANQMEGCNCWPCVGHAVSNGLNQHVYADDCRRHHCCCRRLPRRLHPGRQPVAKRQASVDLRTVGDRNPGFWNARETLGRKAAIPVFVGDVAKGVVAAGVGVLIADDGVWGYRVCGDRRSDDRPRLPDLCQLQGRPEHPDLRRRSSRLRPGRQ